MPNAETHPVNNIENSTALFREYLKLTREKQTEIRNAYCSYFGLVERTFYNRMTVSGIVHTSPAEMDWFCEFLGKSRKKIYPTTQPATTWPVK